MTILDTLPELPKPTALRGAVWPYIYTADQLRERDRIVVEHVVRMCAEVCDSFDPCDPVHIKRTILAILEPKP